MPLGGSIAPRVFSKNLGFAVGGAKDTNNFIENIESGYLPRVSSITYEGQFYRHPLSIFGRRWGRISCKKKAILAQRLLQRGQKGLNIFPQRGGGEFPNREG